MEETWKQIKNFSDYEISSMGKIRSYKKWRGTNERILEPKKNNGGYLYVRLCKNRKRYYELIHRLLYENFVRKLKKNEVVHHVDENKENNDYLNNLKAMDKIKHKIFHTVGENNPNYGKHPSEETRKKQSKRVSGENHYLFGKHPSEETRKKQSEIRKGKYCGENHPMYGKHHTEETKRKQSEKLKGKYLGENNPGSILTEKDVIKIWKDLNEGILIQTEIAKKFGVKQATISGIKLGKSWKYLFKVGI